MAKKNLICVLLKYSPLYELEKAMEKVEFDAVGLAEVRRGGGKTF